MLHLSKYSGYLSHTHNPTTHHRSKRATPTQSPRSIWEGLLGGIGGRLSTTTSLYATAQSIALKSTTSQGFLGAVANAVLPTAVTTLVYAYNDCYLYHEYEEESITPRPYPKHRYNTRDVLISPQSYL